MMKKIALLALVGALVVSLVAGTAVAKPDKGPKKEKTVTYVFHGTVSQVTLASTDPITGEPVSSDSVVVDVKQGNSAARSYVGQQVTFAVGPETKIERNGEEALLSEIQGGDRVKVQVKAPASADTFTARQLQAQGPEEPAQ